MFREILSVMLFAAAAISIGVGVTPIPPVYLGEDTVLIDTGKEVFEISGTNFTDYNFFGASGGGVTGIDVGTPGVTSSVRNFLNDARSSEKESENPGIGKNVALLGSMVGYLYTPPFMLNITGR